MALKFDWPLGSTANSRSIFVDYRDHFIFSGHWMDGRSHGRICHDDVIKWKHFPRYWPFVRGIHRSPVNSSHKGQWRGGLMFTLICVWINSCVNNREAGDLRRYCAHYGVTVMCALYWYLGHRWIITWCALVWLFIHVFHTYFRWSTPAPSYIEKVSYLQKYVV